MHNSFILQNVLIFLHEHNSYRAELISHYVAAAIQDPPLHKLVLQSSSYSSPQIFPIILGRTNGYEYYTGMDN